MTVRQLCITNVDMGMKANCSTSSYARMYIDVATLLQGCFSAICCYKEMPIRQIEFLVDNMIMPLANYSDSFFHLQQIRLTDDYILSHSLHVSIICGIIAKWQRLSPAEMYNVVFAGLLHDIGKTQIPLNILLKPTNLTVCEKEIMKGHVTQGYKMLKPLKEVNKEILSGILQHHERSDGSGYPFSIMGKDIHRYARIIAVADIYEAVTSDRVYQKKRNHSEAIHAINQMRGKLDPYISRVFLSNINQ